MIPRVNKITVFHNKDDHAKNFSSTTAIRENIS